MYLLSQCVLVKLILTNDGLKGGSNFRDITSCQLICSKKLWFIICSASSGPDPNLCDTCLCN